MKKVLAITLIVLLSAGSVAFAHGPGRGHGMLKELDSDSDGRVTREELSAGAKAHFAELDANRDGKVTKDEVEARMRAFHEKRTEARNKAEPGNGKDGKHAAWEAKFRERGAAHFAKADTNGDGALDLKELTAGMDARFARLDGNGDGVLAGDELSRGNGRGKGPDGEGCEHGKHEGRRGDRG